MPPRNRQAQSAPQDSGLPSETTRSQRTKPILARWPRRLFFSAMILLAIVAILPNLIGWLGLHRTLLPWVLGEQAKQISIDQLQLGWLQPVVARQVSFVDRQQQPLVQVAEIRTSQTLWSFVTGSDLGIIKVAQPRLTVVTRSDGSNWEDELALWTSSDNYDSDSESNLPALILQISDGTVEFLDQPKNSKSGLKNLQAEIRTAGECALGGQVSFDVANSAEVGNLQLTFQLDPGAPQISANQVDVQLHGTNFDLSTCSPALQRVLGDHLLGGQWSGDIACQIRDQGAVVAAQIKQFQATQFQFAHPTYLGSDHVFLNKWLINGDAAWKPSGVQGHKFICEADFGKLSLDGELDWDKLNQLKQGQATEWSPLTVTGQLDLKSLVTMLPQTLRLHPELQMESGQISLDLASRNENGIHKWVVDLDTTNLAARRGSERLTWAQPLRLAAVVAQSGQSWEVSQLECASDFLKIDGQANARSGNFQATANLQTLLARLNQFLNLSDWNLNGDLNSSLTWTVTNDNTVATTGNVLPMSVAGQLLVKNPIVQIPGWLNWSAPEIKIDLAGTGQLDLAAGGAIDQLKIQTRVGQEQLRAQTQNRVSLAGPYFPLQLHCELQGDARAWHQHLQALVELPEFSLDGTLAIDANVAMGDDQVRVTQLNYQVDQAKLVGFGVDLQEPQVTGTGELTYHYQTQTLAVSDITLVCAALAARGSPIQLTMSEPLNVTGPVAFRGDLNRLLPWFGIGKTADDIQYFGALEGNLELSTNEQGISAAVQVNMPEVVAAQLQPAIAGGETAWNELLREQQISVQGQLVLAHDFNRLQIDSANCQNPSLSVQIQGRIDELLDRLVMDLQGSWQPDWERINGLLAAYTGNQVQLAGAQRQSFSIAGPLFSSSENSSDRAASDSLVPRELKISTQVAWDRGNVFLLPVGPANAQLSVHQGQLLLATGKIPFSGGEIEAAPQLDMNQPDWIISQPAGVLANNVTITPEICRDWLKYVAPLIADATSAQGKFTVQTDGLELPLNNYTATSAAGQIQLVDVTIGAGPLAEKLIGTVMSVKKMLRPNDTDSSQDLTVWLRLPEQKVPYQISNGRVFHEGVQIGAKEFVIRTRGSVGFDQSLSMTAEVPIPDSWIDGEKWLAGLKGQSLQIPIGGTVSRPVLDTQALQALSRDLVQKLAANQLNQVVTENTQKLQDKVTGEVQQAQQKLQDKFQTEVKDKLDGELKKGFDKLFGPKKDK